MDKAMDIIERLERCEPSFEIFEDAIAEIKRLRELLTPRPIETAPKDGTRVILFFDGYSAEGYWMGNAKENHWGEIGWFETDALVMSSHPCRPKAWLPLPEPPQETK